MEAKNREYLTQEFVDQLARPSVGREIYWDSKIPGFCVRVSQTLKTYFAVRRVNGKVQWVRLGTHDQMTPGVARKKAEAELGKIGKGINVNEEKREAERKRRAADLEKKRQKSITLQAVLDQYLTENDQLRANTRQSYRGVIEKHLKSWLDRPITEISPDMVTSKHAEIKKKSPSQADKAMRVLRLLFNSRDDLIENPTKRLTKKKKWAGAKRRQTVIKPSELPAWYEAVMGYSSPVASDALLLYLLTGLREGELLTLRWSADVDMEDKTFTIRSEISKNHRAHTLPMSEQIFNIFNRRLALRENQWVFPGQGPQGHLRETRRAVEAVTNQSGVSFCLHDLRRTFASFAEQEASYAMLKRLLNHSAGSDVTMGYLVITAEELRRPMQMISDRIMRAIQNKETKGAKVVPIRARG